MLLAAACSAPAPAPTDVPRPTASAAIASAAPPTEAPSAPLFDITVTEDPKADRWSVRYRLSRKVMGIVFERGAKNHFRSTRWSLSADGDKTKVQWTEVAHQDAVVSSGDAFRELTITFATDTENKPSDYLVNGAFTDGSRLFYTGHFVARPLVCAGDAPCNASEATPGEAATGDDLAWHFVTAADRGIQVLDARADGRLDWSSVDIPPAQGTFAYFGNIAAEDTPWGSVIVDPGLPAWMVASAKEAIPKLLEWFATDTHTKLSMRPLVLVAGAGGDKRGWSNKGGSLPGLVQLAAWGDDWKNETDETRFAWRKFLGHELFHLWNGEMFRTRKGMDEAWLSEGSSDYFAWRALRALGYADDATVERRVVSAANRCLFGIRQRPLNGQSGGPEYSCGAMLWAWVDAAARTKKETAGDIFGRVFATATSKGDRRYGTEDVLEEIRKEGVAGGSKPFERVLLEGVASGEDELFSTQLRGAGIPVRLVAPRDATTEQLDYSEQIGVELFRCDCKSHLSINSGGVGLFFNDVQACGTLNGVRVLAVAKHSLSKDASGALAWLIARDPTKPIPVTLDGRSETVLLQCRSDFVPLPFKRMLALQSSRPRSSP